MAVIAGADALGLIEVARHRFIVFREVFPPPAQAGLSFYGGAPVGPPGMAWPRGGTAGRPLTFVMQWDVAALAAADATGLLRRPAAALWRRGWGLFAACLAACAGGAAPGAAAVAALAVCAGGG
jgi:hypothetical protein